MNHTEWRKSQHSGTNSGNCVEVCVAEKAE
ncbi:DUF397 domain-containing protein [Actinoallomurus sp. NPDC052274]